MNLMIISGGQTGVDQAALRAAKFLGIPTGGWAPKGWLTEDGPAPWLATEYGLQEFRVAGYPARTDANAHAADATIWIGSTTSAGFGMTSKSCHRWKKPLFLVEPGITPREVQEWLKVLIGVQIVNVAGNRESVNPGIGQRAESFLLRTLKPFRGI